MQNKTILTPFEQEIMLVIWDLPECDVRAVHTALNKHRQIAYTTVMTVMNRLVGKNILKRKKSVKKFLYIPLTSRKQAAHGILQRFFPTIFDNYGQDGITAFAEEIGHIPKEEREQLKRMLEDEA